MWAKSSEKKSIKRRNSSSGKKIRKRHKKEKMFQWKQEENGLSTIHSIFPATSNPFPLPTFLKSRQASKQAANGQADVNSNVGGDLVKKTPGQQTAVKSN